MLISRVNNRYFFTIIMYCVFYIVNINYAKAKEFSLYMDKTRVIYLEKDRLQSLSVTNQKDYPILLQAKVEPEKKGEPVNFIVTPPLIKLDGNQQVSLRIIMQQPILDDKREHLSYICVKGLPPSSIEEEGKNKANNFGITLNMLINSCEKIIYRPNSIARKPRDIASSLVWIIDDNKLKVTNPTPYYMTIASLNVDDIKIDTQNYIPPFGSIYIDSVKKIKHKVTWSVIEDYGGAGATFSYNLK